MFDWVLTHWVVSLVGFAAAAASAWLAWLFISAPFADDDYDPYY